MMLLFTLTGQVLSGKNHMQIGRDGRHYPLPRWAKWRDEMVRQVIPFTIIKGKRFSYCIEQPCKAHVVFRHGDRRRRDVAGMLDALCHVLERAGVVKDDSLIVDWDVATSAVIHDKPSVWIRLETQWTRTA